MNHGDQPNSPDLSYGTHLPVLTYLLDTFDVRSVMEFGLGNFSTPFFLSRGVRLTSVETDEGWLRHFVGLPAPNHKVIFHPDPNVHDIFEDVCRNNRYDLALVDGPRTTRWRCVNVLFERATIIVAHDTKSDHYDWHRIILPPGFCKMDYCQSVPWTSIIAKDLNIISKVQSELIKPLSATEGLSACRPERSGTRLYETC